MAVALMAAALLLVSGGFTFVRGPYDRSRIALLRVRPLLVGYDVTRAQQFQRDLVLRLHATPGVESASPYSFCGGLVSLPGWAEGRSIRSACLEVGPRYFETLGVAFIEGRDFRASDAVGAPQVAIVGQKLANLLSSDRSAIGTTLRTVTGPRQIVGVVKDTMLPSRAEEGAPQLFVPFLQNPRHADARYVVRVNSQRR
jgi:hypothetical protein